MCAGEILTTIYFLYCSSWKKNQWFTYGIQGNPITECAQYFLIN